MIQCWLGRSSAGFTWAHSCGCIWLEVSWADVPGWFHGLAVGAGRSASPSPPCGHSSGELTGNLYSSVAKFPEAEGRRRQGHVRPWNRWASLLPHPTGQSHGQPHLKGLGMPCSTFTREGLQSTLQRGACWSGELLC